MTGIRRFPADRHGGVAVMMAICLVPMLLSLGVALDLTRIWLLRMRLQQAVDAASLLGANEIGSSSLIADTKAMFWVNYSTLPQSSGTGFLGSTSSGATVTQVDTSHVQVTAQATLPLSLMRLAGSNTTTVASTLAVAAKSVGYEITMALDVTASMLSCADGSTTQNCTTKEQALQTAANNMLEYIYGSSNDTVPNLSVALVPFGSSVNIGTNNQAWLTGYTASNWSAQAWRGCVLARTGSYDTTEDNPGTAAFTARYWASTYQVSSAGNGKYNPGDNDWTSSNISDTGNQVTSQSQVSSYSYLAHGPNLGCTNAAVLPLTASKSTVENAVNGLAAASWDGTIIAQGLQWAWFTLSPAWQNYWHLAAAPSGAARPLAYAATSNYKVVILMTDGNDEWDGNEYSSGFNPGCQNYTVYPECIRVDGYSNAYGRLSDNRLKITMPTAASSSPTNVGTASNTASARAATALDGKTTTLCNNLKQDGITIYTIAFQAAAGSDAETLLKACATDAAHYFNTQTGDDMNAAFQNIAHQLANLRITQ